MTRSGVMRKDTQGMIVSVLGMVLAIGGYWIALESGMTLLSPPGAPWWQTYLPAIVGAVMMVVGGRWMRSAPTPANEAEKS